MTPPPADDIYKRYFGGRTWKGTVEKIEQPNSPSRIQSSESPGSNRNIRPFVGPSSDMLAPVLSVTHDYDSIMLNHQNVFLAKGWDLGAWDFNTIDPFDNYQANAGKVEEYKDEKIDSTSGDFASATLLSRRGGRLRTMLLFFVPMLHHLTTGVLHFFCKVFHITDT
jgi:hypothetical protein